MILLDTNVFSGLMAPAPVLVIREWLDRQTQVPVWTTAVTVYEIRSGIERLPSGWKRRSLEDAFDLVLVQDLKGRVVPFDRAAAIEAARRGAARRRQGFTDDIRDTQIAGIVLARGATLATRNIRHFPDLAERLVDPWEPA